jgi:ATP-dependent DNA ligase
VPFHQPCGVDRGPMGPGLTAEKLKECVWVRPELVARIQFLVWTGADHMRHTKFVALRDDKDPSRVVRRRDYSGMGSGDRGGRLRNTV